MAAPSLAPADRVRYLDMQETATAQFTTVLTKVIKMLHGKNKRNDDFNEIHDKFMAGKEIAPSAILIRAAQSVYNYRNEIAGKDETWLLTHDFSATAMAYMDVPDSDKIEFVSRIIGQTRNVWRGLSSAERIEMWTWLGQILSAVCTYSLASGKLGQPIIVK